MLDSQRLIENIRLILSTGATTTTESLSAAAHEYDVVCAQANARLRKCGDMLRQGLRSEAIQQCEVEPNLLDLVGELDFAELPEWIALVQSRKLEPPPAILLEIAGDLNEAYSQEQPLAAELRKHRLLALGRAPLRDRLNTLRRLAELDAGSHFWLDDIRTFERARLEELRREAKDAYKQGNVIVLEQAATDLTEGHWSEPPQSGLVREVREAYGKLLRKNARADLERLEPQLNQAFAQLDGDAGEKLAARWHACVALCGLDPAEPLAERAAPALDWIAERLRNADEVQSFKMAIAELELALDDESAPQDKLERLAHTVARYERDVPLALQQRVRSRLGAFDLSRSRRMRLVIAGVASFAACVVAVVALLLWQHRHHELVAGHVATIKHLNEQELWNESEQHLKHLEKHAPEVHQTPGIQALVTEVAGLKKREAERKAAFDRALEQVKNAPEDSPAVEQLEIAIKRARTPDEKAVVVGWKDKVDAVLRRQQAARDQQYVKQLGVIRQRISNLEKNKTLSLESQAKELAELQQELQGLPGKIGKVSDALLGGAKADEGRISALNEGIQRAKELNASVAKITRAATLARFAEELHAFTDDAQFAGSDRAKAFSDVLTEKPLWQEIEDWNKTLKELTPESIAGLSAAEARARESSWQGFLKEHGGHPAAVGLAAKLPFLKSIMARVDEENQKIDATLRSLFTNDSILTWYIVVFSDPAKGETEKYYTPKLPQVSAGDNPIKIEYFKDFGDAGDGGRPADFGARNFRPSTIKVGKSPQMMLAASIRPKLNGLQDRDWEQTFKSVVTAIANNDELEPIVKYSYLKKVLDVACRGSLPVESRLGRTRSTLVDAAVDQGAKWMDPDDPNASQTRKIAEEVLSGLPKWETAWQSVDLDLKQFHSPPELPSEWVGWVYRSQDAWHCELRDKTKRTGVLYVAVRSGGERDFRWERVGSSTAGVVKLDETSSGLLEGRPVFFRQESL